ncbi:hypothetical protein IHQ68_01595 [Chelatococcus sambhunathii]|uniref:Uncharacterized protein n=1 Tax=Chelatococcus sambhunathii TaxID=363953 RepID=A0ABU1DBL9_9HYPH|nr:hypothetical protein [Chelatococcus sambhunathii]MDR4305315.1 hypothetical protein [Chelatococcus sambhunathii]
MSMIRPAALSALEEKAVEAASVERDFRENYAQEIARLERERQRAWRRFNFLAALVAADFATPDRDASRAAQRAAAIDELDWPETDPATANLLDAMTQLADAIHDERLLTEADAAAETLDERPVPVSGMRNDPAAARAPAILFALAAFEERYEQIRGKPFAAQFDRTFAETPLVDF